MHISHIIYNGTLGKPSEKSEFRGLHYEYERASTTLTTIIHTLWTSTHAANVISPRDHFCCERIKARTIRGRSEKRERKC